MKPDHELEAPKSLQCWKTAQAGIQACALGVIPGRGLTNPNQKHAEELNWQVGGKESEFIGRASQVSSFPLEFRYPAASKQATLIRMDLLTDTATGCHWSND